MGEGMQLRGQRVLVLEDEPIIALDIASTITQAQGEVLGPVANVADALKLAETGGPSLAILDFDLGHEVSSAVALKLAALDVPFIFYTGTRVHEVEEAWPEATIITKPRDPRALVRTLASFVRPAQAFAETAAGSTV